jgi:hypothetical protein
VTDGRYSSCSLQHVRYVFLLEDLPFALVIALAASQASVLASLKDEALELFAVFGLASGNGRDDAPHGLLGSVATTVVLLDELILELTLELTTDRAEDTGGETRAFRSFRDLLSPTVCELSSSQAISAPNMLKSGDLPPD